MARPLRIEYPGAVYHITARGNSRQAIFLNDGDRKRFIQLMSREIAQQGWRCYAYCLMRNHYHLLLETPGANLIAGMRRLNGVYTQGFNRSHHRVGHVLQGRYKSIVVERESYLLELCRYVVLNPVRAGAARGPDQWLWSSYRATGGMDPSPDWLEVDWILTQFNRDKRVAEVKYRQFVNEKTRGRSPWESLRGQVWLGGSHFLDQMEKALRGGQSKEFPKNQRHPTRPSSKEILEAVTRVYEIESRQLRKRMDLDAYKAAVYLLRRGAGLGIESVGALFAISGSRVSKIQREIEEGEVDSRLRTLLHEYKVKI